MVQRLEQTCCITAAIVVQFVNSTFFVQDNCAGVPGMEQTREHDPLFTSNFSLSVTTRTMAGSGVFQTATFIAVLIVGIAMAVIHVIPEETSVVDAITQFFVNLFQLTSTSGLTSKDIAAVNEELLKLPVTEQPDAVLRWASNTFAHGR